MNYKKLFGLITLLLFTTQSQKIFSMSASAAMAGKSLSEKLFDAIAVGNKNEVTRLIEDGADPNARNLLGETPLHHAAYFKHNIDIVRILIERGADPNILDEMGHTPLHDVASDGDTNIAHFLIENGADPDILDKDDRRTPLHYTAFGGNTDIARFLIENGADINIPDGVGWPPLHRAVANKHMGIVHILIERGTDINARNKDGRTPLYYAALSNQIDLFHFLIKRGANINALDKNRETILHRAASNCQTETVQLLLSMGADPRIKNNYGKTPDQVTSNPEIRRLIKVKRLIRNARSLKQLCAIAAATRGVPFEDEPNLPEELKELIRRLGTLEL